MKWGADDRSMETVKQLHPALQSHIISTFNPASDCTNVSAVLYKFALGATQTPQGQAYQQEMQMYGMAGGGGMGANVMGGMGMGGMGMGGMGAMGMGGSTGGAEDE